MKWDLGENVWLGDENGIVTWMRTEARIQAMSVSDLQALAQQHVLAEGDDREFGDSHYMVSRADNLALVNISGQLVTRHSEYNRYMGRVSYDEIRNAVFAAMETPGIEGIVLNMDTPGGQASGISDLSDFLQQVDQKAMPVFVYTGTSMASGGYWLGSVGREIYASKLATVGSIGVITVHASYEKMLKQDGIEVTVLRAGEFKALGSPYEKLDEKARAQIESQMNAIYDVFLETVAENRGTSVSALKATAAEGRVFVGADAVTVGLVDSVASFDAAISAISKKVSGSSSRSHQPSPSTYIGEIPMGKKRVLTEAATAAIASGAPEAEVVKQPGMTVEVDDDGQGAPAADAAAGSPETPPAPEAPAAATPAPDSGVSVAMLDNLLAKVSDLTIELATTKASLKQAEQARDASAATEASLVKIAIQAINRMQVGLGGVPMNVESADVGTVLAQYSRTYSLFNQRYPVGATAKVPQGEDFNAEAATNDTLLAAQQRLTGARPQNIG